MNPLADRLGDSLRRHATRPALRIGDEILSYSALGDRAYAFAERLDRLTAPDARIGLTGQRSVDAFIAVLGAVLSGRAYVPINPAAPFERQRAIAAAAGCAAYAVEDATQQRAEMLCAEFGGICIAAGPLAGGPTEAVASPAGPRSAHAYVMFTSGTTGVPKGVAVRPDNVVAYIDAFAQIAPLSPDDRCTQLFDLSFDLSVHDMFVTWANGALLCTPSEAEMLDPVGFAARNRCTVWFSVPSVAAFGRRTRRLKPDALPDLRMALFCGEPLPTSLARDFAAAAPAAALWNLYGPTEATIAITAHLFEPGETDQPATVPLGTAYTGSEVLLVDGTGEVVALGGSGELWLAGAQLSDGYINNPTEQAAKFVVRKFHQSPFDRWYRSGDVVTDDPVHGLVYRGRLDDQVKVSGYRVELLEIEEAMRTASATADVAVVPYPLNEGGSADGLVACLVEGVGDDRTILARCRELLPSYMVPKRIVRLDALPLNANGKVDRRALQDIVAS